VHEPVTYRNSTEESKVMVEKTFDLTTNETCAVLELLKCCLDNMGGKRPADLEHDELTWVEPSDLQDAGWSKHEAAGTFSSLIEKKVIAYNGKKPDSKKNEYYITTSAWRWADTIWETLTKR
jgi:hypothetical protein